MKSKCDSCKWKSGDYGVFDQGGQGWWWTDFCCKGHWDGNSSFDEENSYNDCWDNCVDFEENNAVVV